VTRFPQEADSTQRGLRGDFVRSFQIEGMNVRGRIVHLTDLADRVLGAHGYPDSVSGVVGEALALAALLGASLKFDGVMTLQTRSDGPLRMVVADYSSPGTVRACATFDRDAVEALGPAPAFEDLVGAGSLAITIDPGGDMGAIKASCRWKARGLRTRQSTISSVRSRFRRASSLASRR
jgi:molecular chaperone Hsp33